MKVYHCTDQYHFIWYTFLIPYNALYGTSMSAVLNFTFFFNSKNYELPLINKAGDQRKTNCRDARKFFSHDVPKLEYAHDGQI